MLKPTDSTRYSKQGNLFIITIWKLKRKRLIFTFSKQRHVNGKES